MVNKEVYFCEARFKCRNINNPKYCAMSNPKIKVNKNFLGQCINYKRKND